MEKLCTKLVQKFYYNLLENWKMKNFNNPLKNFHHYLHLCLGDIMWRLFPNANPLKRRCSISDMNKAEVQWSFRGISTPIDVATYNNIRIKDALPTQEQLKERMELLQREMCATKRLMKGKK